MYSFTVLSTLFYCLLILKISTVVLDFFILLNDSIIYNLIFKTVRCKFFEDGVWDTDMNDTVTVVELQIMDIESGS